MTTASTNQLNNDSLIINYKRKNKWMKRITNRFSTYGFSQITTTTFENYNAYMHLQGTVKTNEMVKTIDHTGNILTLRSDATIPITEQLIREQDVHTSEKRYFYVLDVFRYPVRSSKPKENTQAGIECFGVNGVETDAEIIALAMHTLKDLNRPSFTLEIGHAGFFERCISALQVNKEQRNNLKQLLQTKNIGELKHFLEKLQVADEWKRVIELIPLLYGKPSKVIDLVRTKINDPIIHEQMNQFEKLYTLLEAYNLADHVVIDLSLMNHMDYYSDIIFQGFIHNVAKPVLMGGRYNDLTAYFGHSIPAIGFACDIDAIVESDQETDVALRKIDICIQQTEQTCKDSLALSTFLRDNGWSTRTIQEDQPLIEAVTTCTIFDKKDKQVIKVMYQGCTKEFTSYEEVESYIQQCILKEK